MSYAQDFRYSVRMLRHSPGFTLIAITALALGIGANTAIFSVVNAVLLRSLPFAEPDRLVMLYQPLPSKGIPKLRFAAPDYLEIRDGNHSFSQLGQYFTDEVNLAGKEAPERVRGAFVTIGVLDLLGVHPEMGRTFSSDEEKYGNNRVAVLSDALWRRNFAANPNILGQQVDFNGLKYTIVGVMPGSFEFPDSRTEIWAPLPFKQGDNMLTRNNHFLLTIARLRSGITIPQARTDVQAIARRLEKEHIENAGMGAEAVSLREDRVGDVRKTLMVLLGAVSLVLLIACANVANLLLARAATRHKEIGMRAALGAGRWRLVRQFLMESVTLSLAGGMLGVLVALWGIQLISAMKPANIPGFQHIAVDGPVLGYALLLSFLTGIIFGLFPALQASKADLAETLKEAGRSNTSSVGRRRLRNVLVAAEVAISLVLLIGAGLLIGTLARLQSVDPGFRPDHVLTMFLNLPQPKYPKEEQAIVFYRELLRRLQTTTGVQAAAISSFIPLSDSGWGKFFTVEARPPRSLADAPLVSYRQVTPQYFQALGIRLVKGRYFEETDDATHAPVAIVNESVARRFFPNESAIGKRVFAGVPEHLVPPDPQHPNFRFPRLTIVGVIRDTKQYNVSEPSEQELYIPYLQGGEEAGGGRYLVLRVKGDPLAFAGAVREQVRSLDKDLPLAQVASMDQLLAKSMSQRRFNMLLLIVFAVLAAVLAAVGLYGVIAYSVTQRTQEIGVRMALGARTNDVLGMILRQGVAVALAGILAGAIASVGLTSIIASLLFETKPTDLVTFVSASALLFAIALIACLIPALRASRLDPLEALRYE